MNVDSPGDLLRAYQSSAKKRFGQHFITDPNILRRIAEAAGVSEGAHVLEIGPGCGTLTWQLLELGARVTAVEIDRDAVRFLDEQFRDEDRLHVIEADATSYDFGSLAGEDQPRLVVANLPYNVAIPILFRLLDAPVQFEALALMFQREVANRITASPGTKAYGSLTLEIERRADVESALKLKPGAFTPAPKVDSAVVVFRPHSGSRIDDAAARELFSDVVTAGFAMRRKTLRNALKARWPVADVDRALDAAGLQPRIRAERVGFEGFSALAESLATSSSEGDESEQ